MTNPKTGIYTKYMYAKLKFIYIHHFKLIIFLNFGLSLFFSYLFFLKGFDKIPLYSIALFFKLIGYATTFAIEKLLFSQRKYYYLNMGLSYRRLFSVLFGIDFVVFVFMLGLVTLCQAFI